MIVVGIDPGLTGGICILDRERRVHALIAMPVLGGEVDSAIVADILKASTPPLDQIDVFLELVGVMPYRDKNGKMRSQGAKAAFTFGCAFGDVRGPVMALRLPLHQVRPKDWQKVCHAGSIGSDPKERSIAAASRLYPSVDLVRGTTATRERATKPHLGLVDALLIAHYGWVTLYGGKAHG